MQVVLVMFRAGGERRSFSVVRDVTVLGRREDCDLRIPLGDVSRKHCRIIRSSDTVRLEDLGSSNGTLCNGQRITSVELRPGDTIVLGPVTFVVQIDGVPADENLAPHGAKPASGGDATSVVGVQLDALDDIEPTGDENIGVGASNAGSAGTSEPSRRHQDDDLVSLEPAPEPAVPPAQTGTASSPKRVPSPAAETAIDAPSGARPSAGSSEPSRKKKNHKAEKGAKNGQSQSAAAKTPEPAGPAADPHVIEGELQASDQFDSIQSNSEFDIVLDDVAQGTANGEIQIDWRPESNT